MIDKICLDFETYYDKEFSLSKLTTEEYVRDPRFEIIGVGIKYNDNPARWFSGQSQVNDVLRMIPWHKVALLCHNTNFDGFILSEHFGVSPRLYLDTLSMARPWHGMNAGGSLKKLAEHYELGAKGTEVVQALGKRRADFTPEDLAQYGEYCKNDCELTAALFDKLAPLTPVNELLLIDRTVRMFCLPKLTINADMVAEHLQEEIARKEALLQEVEDVAPKDVLMSNPKLHLLLESLGVDVPMKITPTGRTSPAFGKTDKAFVTLLDYEGHNAELVRGVVAARLGVKSTIDETRAQRFLGIAQRGALPVDLQYCGALTTARWAGSGRLNLQNLRRGGVLRRSLTAPDGQVVVAVDSSNIELRVNHTISEQWDTVQMFREGRDLYCEFASVLFGRPITKADKHERQLGKLCIAEGSLVLTDTGLVPIEQVTTLHRVWDGVEWVSHEGAVLAGEKEVMTYDSLTATPDHIVYLRDGSFCRLDEAAHEARSLACTGDGGYALRTGTDFIERSAAPGQSATGTNHLRVVPDNPVDKPRQPSPWGDEWVPNMQPTEACSAVAGQTPECHAAALHECEGQSVLKLRGERGTVSIPLRIGSGAVDSGESGATPCDGVGSDKQQRALRTGQFAVGKPAGEYEQSPKLGNTFDATDSHRVPGSSVCGQHTANEAGARTNNSPDCRAMGTPLVQTKRRVWDILNAGPRHRFTVSDRLVSNCHLSLGYGCGADKFREICRLNKVELSAEDAKRIVTLWRDTYAQIPAFWRTCNAALTNIATGAETWIDNQMLCSTGFERINTKPHNQILYPALTQQGDKWTYKMRNETKFLYGAKLVENVCVDGEALVLTELGWKPLNQLGSERVHDGVEFVSHGGKVLNGVQHCVTVDSVFMTPTHEVLTDEGWKPALEKPRPYRPTIRNAHCDTTESLGREKNALAFQVYLRKTNRKNRMHSNQRGEAWGNAELRLHDQAAYKQRQRNARDDEASGICGVAQYVRQVQAAFASRVEKLRRAWHNCVRRMGDGLLGVLARYGAELSPWAYAGSFGQRERVQYAQLRVADAQTTSTEHSALHRSGHVRFVRPSGSPKVDVILPMEEGLTRCGLGSSGKQEEISGGKGGAACKVFDVVNCGPRNRFVLLGENGPFIVHNCQHLARNIIADQLLAISARYPVVLTVHDEIVYLAPETEAQEALDFGIAAMSKSPAWWPAIPLAAEGEYGRTYS